MLPSNEPEGASMEHNMKLGSASLSTLPPEQETIRAKCFHPSGSFVEFPAAEIEQSIPERFEKVVQKYPERLAIKTRTHSFSYEKLNHLANRIARAILERCGDDSELVALVLTKDAPMVAAILGALKAGKAYIPVDPSHPASRNRYLIEDTRARLLLSDNHNFSITMELAEGRRELINIDEIDSEISAENPRLKISPDDLAYVRYTSGSTGKPKGVMENQRNLLHVVMRHTNSFHICAEDRLMFLGSWGKHAFRGLLNGAALYPTNVMENGFVHVRKSLADEEITICHSTPSVFRHLVETFSPHGSFPSLRLIRLAGEPVARRDVELFKIHFSSKCVLVNEFGSTEAGTIAHYFIDKETQISGNTVPVGYPVDDTRILLLADGKPAAVDDVGEIAISSKYLSPGYWQRPDLTELAFLPDPLESDKRIYLTGDLGLLRADGCLVHVGRRDFQLKIRGNRVEVTETEMALLSHPAIKDAIVTGREDQDGNQCLVAYFVPSIKPAPAAKDLRSFLSVKLPDYMVPTMFVILDALPLTHTGKVDRNALLQPQKSLLSPSPPYIAPRSALEAKMAGIWAEVLAVEKVGLHDNFFDLGGQSLLAAKLFVRLDEEFGVSLPLSDLLAAPTVQTLAARYASLERFKDSPVLVALRVGGGLNPVYAVPGVFGNVLGYADLCHSLGLEQPFYAFQSIGLDGARAPLESIEMIAEVYVAEIHKVQPRGPYALIGACFGGTVAYEMARQLLDHGEEVAFLGLLDPGRGQREEGASGFYAAPRFVRLTNAIGSLLTSRLLLYVKELWELKRGHRIGFLKNKIHRLTLKLVHDRALRGIQRELHQLEVYKANKLAHKRYRRKPLNGKVRVLEIFESTHPRNKRSSGGIDWQQLWTGGEPEKHSVPGKDSGDMMTGQNARVLAALLNERLRAAFTQEIRRANITANEVHK
jgi:amino acid adenylation domain-containing protein